MSMQMIILIIVCVVIFILVLSYISISNKIVRANIKIDESLSGIDVALAKRHDVLVKMIEVVKGYAKHEQETLFKVIELRNNMTIDEKSSVNKEMSEQLEKVNILAENYPDLKASENFKKLQLSILDVEEHLQAARRLYNANVSLYNQMIKIFPNNMIANSKKYKERSYFAADEESKKNVDVSI